jgi:uncharacterized protein (DUF488 family)
MLTIVSEENTVMMCVEAVPWRCHRTLVGDVLLVRGIVMEDVLPATRRTPHIPTS